MSLLTCQNDGFINVNWIAFRVVVNQSLNFNHSAVTLVGMLLKSEYSFISCVIVMGAGGGGGGGGAGHLG